MMNGRIRVIQDAIHEWAASWLPDWVYGRKLRLLCLLTGHWWTQGAPWKDFVCFFCFKRAKPNTFR